jgi:hypothetical protein
MSKPRTILVTTLYGRDNRIPMVQIEVPNGKAQLTIEEAEDLARNLVHASEASLTDAFLIEFLRGPALELEDAQVWGLIREFREWREARIAQPPPGWKSGV